MEWIISNERRPYKKGFYYTEDSIGNKTMVHFYEGHWHSLTGHPVIKWLDEELPSANSEAGEQSKVSSEDYGIKINMEGYWKKRCEDLQDGLDSAIALIRGTFPMVNSLSLLNRLEKLKQQGQ